MTSAEIRLKMLREQASNEVKVTQHKIALIFDEMIRLENSAISKADAYVLSVIADDVFSGDEFWAALKGERSVSSINPDIFTECRICGHKTDYNRLEDNQHLCADCEFDHNYSSESQDRAPAFLSTNPAGMPK